MLKYSRVYHSYVLFEGCTPLLHTLGGEEKGRIRGYVLPYKWLFSRVVYFTNGPSFSISTILISRMAAGDHNIISLILVKYFKILYFTN